ncbi:MAG: ATP-binding cassette domain-containing protein [Mycoplasmataceae bacterium]|nr:ATP-binding cassette domain-containing protein [Mycoplasmataceae bacterium]
MAILEVKDLTYIIGTKTLYENASFDLNRTDHMGIVGQNGVGKSTLINIIISKVEQNSGTIKWQKGIKMGYLDQHAEIDGELTVFEFLKTAFKSLFEAEQALNDLYLRICEEQSDELNDQIEQLQNRLMFSGFYDIDNQIMKVASGLGVTAIGVDKLLKNLSGGQRAKVILTKLLLESPDILIMDEPTNFLDVEHIDWLKKYLHDYEGAFIVISHDFDFLDYITNCVIDIEFQKIKKYSGSFSQFEKQKQLDKELQQKAYEKQQKEIQHLQSFIDRFSAGTRATMAQSRQKVLDKMEIIEPPKSLQKPNFNFNSIPLGSNKEMLIVNNLTVGYDKPLLKNISFKLNSGEKLVITGFNGIGKSTLIKTIIGKIPALSGDFEFEYHVQWGYFEQELHWEDPKLKPFEILGAIYPDMEDKEVFGKLALCGVKGKMCTQPISSLSGGEQCKVKLCILMLEKTNLLILDEPTNHLDQEAKEVLKKNLIDWKGGILMISHDKEFYDGWINRVISVK